MDGKKIRMRGSLFAATSLRTSTPHFITIAVTAGSSVFTAVGNSPSSKEEQRQRDYAKEDRKKLSEELIGKFVATLFPR